MRRRSVVLAAPLSAALLLAGCAAGGGDGSGAQRGDGPVTIETIQLAASNTQAAESISYEIDVTGGDAFSMHANGVTSADGKTGQTVVETPNGRFEQRMVDGVAYLDFSGLDLGDLDLGGLGATDGKQWVALDLNGLGDLLGKDAAGAFGGFGAQTPDSALGMLRQLSGDVEQVGDDTIAGRHAIHYRATIDAAGASTPVDVWIDDQDRVVKMHAALGDGNGELTMQITEFGAPVDVVAPPADEVADIGDLVSGLLPEGLQPREGLHI